MQNEIINSYIEGATFGCELAIQFDYPKLFIEGLFLKQYLYEKEDDSNRNSFTVRYDGPNGRDRETLY